MASNYKTGLVITGNADGAVKATKLTQRQLEALNKTKGRARTRARDYARELGDATKKLAKWGALAGGAAAAGALVMINRQRQLIDQTAKTSQLLGIATEDLAAMQLQAELTGVANEKLTMGLQRMTRRVSEAAKGSGEAQAAIKELGLDAVELNRLDPAGQFRAIGEAMENVSNQSDRVRLGFKLFDSEGAALVRTLDGGAQAAKEAAEFTERWGLALSRTDAAQVERANDAMTQVARASEGFWKQLTVKLSPALEGVAQEILGVGREYGGAEDAATLAYEKMITGAGFVMDSLDGVGRVARSLANILIVVAEANSMLTPRNYIWGDGDFGESLAIIKEALADIRGQAEKPLAGEEFRKWLEGVEKQAAITALKVDDLTERSTEWGEAAAEGADAATESAKELDDQLQSILDKLYPQQQAVRELSAEWDRLYQAVANDQAPRAALGDWLEQNVMIESTTRDINVALADTTAETERMGVQVDSLATITRRGFERMRDGVGDFFQKLIVDGKASFGDLVDMFKSAIAEMIATAATNKIVLSLGLGGTSSLASAGASAAGQGGGGGGLLSMSNLSSGGSMLSMLNGGLAGAGQSVIQLGAEGLAGMGFRETAASFTRGGTAYMNNMSGGMGGMAGGIAMNALAGYAGNWAGNKLGEAVFGKEAESAWGATAGGVIGSIWGPVGTAIGSAIGGLVDVAFGGDGKKRAALGVTTNTNREVFADHAGQTATGASGLEFTAYAKRAGDQGLDAANKMVEQFAAADNMLVDLAERMFDVTGIDLAGVSLGDKSSEAETSGSGFFGSAMMNGLSREELEGAGARFVQEWAAAVNAKMGTDIDFDPLLDLQADSESVAGTLQRVQVQLSATNELFEALGMEAHDFSMEGLRAADQLARGMAQLQDVDAGELFSSGQFQEQMQQWFSRAATLNNLESMTGGDPVDQWRANQGTTWDAWQQQGDAVSAVAEVARTEQELANLTQMVRQRYQTEQELIGQIMGYMDNAASNFAQTYESIFLDGLESEKERYQYFREQADQIARTAHTLTDPDEINRAQEDYNRLINRAYGALGEGSADKMRDEILETLTANREQFTELLQERLDAISADADPANAGSVANVVQGTVAGLREELRGIIEDMVAGQQEAADTQQEAAQTWVQGVQEWNAGNRQWLQGLPGSITINMDGQEVNA